MLLIIALIVSKEQSNAELEGALFYQQVYHALLILIALLAPIGEYIIFYAVAFSVICLPCKTISSMKAGTVSLILITVSPTSSALPGTQISIYCYY